MMFASKMPTLRIDESDLKCKNGCDYYGNSQWQGYCSKCHREQMQRKRQAEKATTASTLPKPDRKKPAKSLKLTSNSSFSKFEEKRLRQSETQKKANLLKFSVFKKSSSVDHSQDSSEKKSSEFKIPSIVYETMKRDFHLRFPQLGAQVHRDARQFVSSFITDVMRNAHVLNVDELSERVQRQYQHFMKHMDTSSHYANLDSDDKELLIDYVEKHAMSYLHELPSVVFSPSGTDDERLDRVLSERIQQLGWVCERHLECRVDRARPACRRLLYRAIGELLGMDGASSPGGKLARVRRCCTHVLELAADASAPASADELLPALIFTVLKANPPRLISNINFVTRFCNATRLMTGEGGYYFTNLCCAVSFIENMTAESLNMDKEEFDCYMAMPASIGGSSWAATLSLCAELRESEELSAQADQLRKRTEAIVQRADELQRNTDEFEKEISNKVHEVLKRTPLEIKPRREVPGSTRFKEMKMSPLIDLEPVKQAQASNTKLVDLPSPIVEDSKMATRDTPELQTEDVGNPDESSSNTLGFEVIGNLKSPMNLEHNIWGSKLSNSMELLTPSPLGFTSFDSRSIDELMTPDEFGNDQLAPGLSNINYDIDLSDFSADNSVAEDAPKNEPKDIFSPDELKNVTEPVYDPFSPPKQNLKFNQILDSFDQFSINDSNTKESFEETHRVDDPFSPVGLKPTVFNTNNVLLPTELIAHKKIPDGNLHLSSQVDAVAGTSQLSQNLTSLLDKNDSPIDACLLPSPLQPQNSGGVDKVS